MEEALHKDSMEFVTNSFPLAYLKTGCFLDSLTRNALWIYNPADTSYTVKLYTLENEKWVMNDSLSSLWGLSAFFDIKIMDYNFDGTNDIFIQTSVSDRLSVARGHLLTIDPQTKKLTWHDEAKELGNLTPDKEKMVVYSQEAIIGNYGEWKYQTTANGWEEGKLIPVRKDSIIFQGN